MKVPKARKLGSGNYNITMCLNGVNISVTRPTEKECKREAELIKAEHRAEKRVISSKGNMTLKQCMKKYCDEKETVLSPATIRGYYSIMEHRFQSVINTPVRKIANWQKVVNDECKDVKPKTVANAWGLVTASLDYFELPVPKITLPEVPENDLPWIEPEDIMRFVDAARGNKYEIGILLALHSLRRSEIFGLRWENVDLKHGTVTVSGAKVFDKDNNFIYKETNKTKSSVRTERIMIPRLLELLEAVEDKTGPVVDCYPDTLYKNINRICKETGLEKVGCHGLRRTFASLAYSLKWSERSTMQAGGWSDGRTMHKFYVKLSQKEKNEDSDRMEGFYSQK